MERARSLEEAARLAENTIIGTPKMENVEIVFSGSNNILYCEEGVSIVGSTINFKGSDALLLLRKSKYAYRLSVDLWGSTTIAFDRGSYFNGVLHAIVSERQAIIAGRDCLFSFGVWMRTADPHLLYSCKTHDRINNSRPIIIGDHVWIGQDAFLLKGTSIGSGSVVAARSVVSGKTIPSNTCWGGSPAREISTGVFFCPESVHAFTVEETERSQYYPSSRFIYQKSVTPPLCDLLHRLLDAGAIANQRLDTLLDVLDCDDHNRFTICSAANTNSSLLCERHNRCGTIGSRLKSMIKKLRYQTCGLLGERRSA